MSADNGGGRVTALSYSVRSARGSSEWNGEVSELRRLADQLLARAAVGLAVLGIRLEHRLRTLLWHARMRLDLERAALRLAGLTESSEPPLARAAEALRILDQRHDADCLVLVAQHFFGPEALDWSQRRMLAVFDEVAREALSTPSMRSVLGLLSPVCEARLHNIAHGLHERTWWYSYPAVTGRGVTVGRRRSRRRDPIVVLIDALDEEYQTTLVRSIVCEAARHGFGCVVVEVGDRHHAAASAITELYDRLVSPKHVEGVIVATGVLGLSPDEMKALCEDIRITQWRRQHQKTGVPVITVGASVDGFRGPRVSNVGGMKQAVDHLVRHHACRKIGIIMLTFARTTNQQYTPTDWLSSPQELAEAAAHLKNERALGLADAFAAALATSRKADLVTGDTEFRALEKEIRIVWLK